MSKNNFKIYVWLQLRSDNLISNYKITYMGAANSYEENEHLQEIISNPMCFDQWDIMRELNKIQIDKESDFQSICSECIDDQQDCRSTQEASESSLSSQLSNFISESKQVDLSDVQNSAICFMMKNFDINQTNCKIKFAVNNERENNETIEFSANLNTLNYDEICNQSEVEDFFAASSLSIRNVSKIIYCLYKLSNKSEWTEERLESSEEFNEPKFKTYDVQVVRSGLFSTSSPCFIFNLEFIQKKMRNFQVKIEKLLRFMYDKIECPDEVLLFMLVYIKRIVIQAGVIMSEANWRPIVFTAFYLAAKYTYDCWYKSKDYATLMEIYSAQEINGYEKKFLNKIDFKLFVTLKDIKRLLRYSNQVCGNSRKNSNNQCEKLLLRQCKTQIYMPINSTNSPRDSD